MPKYEVVRREDFENRFWRRPDNFAFAASDVVIPVPATEVAQAALHLPLAFTLNQDNYELVALAGLTQGQSLLIDGSGRWLSGYRPVLLDSYPFRLVSNQQDDMVLVVDTESGLVSDDASDEAFFDADGQPSEGIAAVLARLGTLHHGQLLGFSLCSTLQEAGVLEPWPLSIKTDSGEFRVEGLHRINEPALGALSDEAFLKLRRNGALILAYSQLISMGNIHLLGNLLARSQQAAGKSEAAGKKAELDLEFLNKSGTISFS